jgi:hypothetical protein
MRYWTGVLLLLFGTSTALANGSSGIGTAGIPITGEIAAALPSNFAHVQDGKIVDGTQPIFELSPVKRPLEGDQWFSVLLGSVQGYEYRPGPDSTELNAWVICESKVDSCTKLVPLSKSNRKIPAIIGSFVQMRH